jgi:hypothetical protein
MPTGCWLALHAASGVVAGYSTGSLAFTMDAAGISNALGGAYDDYFALSDILNSDLEALLGQDLDIPMQRRNFLRASWALIEGDTESLLRITKSVIEASEAVPTSKQEKLLENERNLDSCTRIKECLKLAWAVFDIEEPPDFCSTGWTDVLVSNARRDRITHPKTAADLAIPEEEWKHCYAAIEWLVHQFVRFHELSKHRYLDSES